MIVFDDQKALDDYVRRVLIAHLEQSEAISKDSMEHIAKSKGVGKGGREIIEFVAGAVYGCQRIAIEKLPLPKVER